MFILEFSVTLLTDQRIIHPPQSSSFITKREPWINTYIPPIGLDYRMAATENSPIIFGGVETFGAPLSRLSSRPEN